jgi:hypothetical protein
MSGDFQYDVFLSHNAKVKLRVRRLAERLRAARSTFAARPSDFAVAFLAFSVSFSHLVSEGTWAQGGDVPGDLYRASSWRFFGRGCGPVWKLRPRRLIAA